MAVHVRYKSLFISLPSSAKQQREMTKFFEFPFGFERRRFMFSFTFLEPLAYRTDLDNREFR